MNVTSDRVGTVAVVRLAEPRLMYPLLSDFTKTVAGLFAANERKVVIDLSAVAYVDSATIGCLMDLYRQATNIGGTLALSGVQKRVETMLTMTGAHNFLTMHATEADAVRALGGTA